MDGGVAWRAGALDRGRAHRRGSGVRAAVSGGAQRVARCGHGACGRGGTGARWRPSGGAEAARRGGDSRRITGSGDGAISGIRPLGAGDRRAAAVGSAILGGARVLAATLACRSPRDPSRRAGGDRARGDCPGRSSQRRRCAGQPRCGTVRCSCHCLGLGRNARSPRADAPRAGSCVACRVVCVGDRTGRTLG